MEGNRSERPVSTALYTTFGFATFVGFGSLALDLGYANFAKGEVQLAADSAAIAAAISMSVDASPDEVRAAAQRWGQQNAVGSTPVVVNDGDVRRGTWEAGVFTASGAGSDVWVRAHTEDVPAFLSRIWGRTGLDTQATAIARLAPPFVCAMIGRDDAKVHGSPTMLGYDSTVSLNPEFAFDVTGAVCSNATIPVVGDPYVDGSVRPGIGQQVTGGGTVTGSTLPLCTNLDFDAPAFPNGLKPWAAGVNINSSTPVVLAPGSYRINTPLEITGQGQLQITGPTTLYVNNVNLTLTGQGVLNKSGNPRNLKIYVRDTGAPNTIKINGTSAFHGFVYAPDTDVQLSGTAAFSGAVVASTLDVAGDMDVYMDTSLMDDEIQCGVQLVQ
jgi:hypothetical protein